MSQYLLLKPDVPKNFTVRASQHNFFAVYFRWFVETVDREIATAVSVSPQGLCHASLAKIANTMTRIANDNCW